MAIILTKFIGQNRVTIIFEKTIFGQNWVTITFIDHKRVEPGKFRIGRVGRAHNDYYEVTLKDRYYDDGGDNEFTLFSPDAS